MDNASICLAGTGSTDDLTLRYDEAGAYRYRPTTDPPPQALNYANIQPSTRRLEYEGGVGHEALLFS